MPSDSPDLSIAPSIQCPAQSPVACGACVGSWLCAGPARSRSGRGEAPGLGRNRRVGSSPSSRRRRAAVCCPSPWRRWRAAPARPAGEPREPHVSWAMKLNPQQAPLYGPWRALKDSGHSQLCKTRRKTLLGVTC
ncbi:uncharacterized protein LOC144255454 [Urocitellus parryii]